MARSGDWELIEMAVGDPKPAWILQGVTPDFSLTSVGGGRPWNCAAGTCERWHAGVDLTNAKDGGVVLAPEAGTIVGVDQGWSEGSKAVFLHTDSGLFVVLGGTKLGSGKEFGITKGVKVKKGQPVGRVLGSYGMIHLETYEDKDGTRTKNTPWPAKSKPPAGLLNPTWWIQAMVGQQPAFLTTRQKLQVLKDLGWYTGPVDATWGAEATASLKKAQAAYGLVADGIWGAKTDAAMNNALRPDSQLPDAPKPPPAKPPNTPPGNDPISKPAAAAGVSGTTIMFGVLGGAVVLGGIAAALSARPKRHSRKRT